MEPGEKVSLEVQNGRLVLEKEAGARLLREGGILLFDVKGQGDIRAAVEEDRERHSRAFGDNQSIPVG